MLNTLRNTHPCNINNMFIVQVKSTPRKLQSLYGMNINNKPTVFIFKNIEHAKRCTEFLTSYKYLYNEWPSLNLDNGRYRHDLPSYEKKYIHKHLIDVLVIQPETFESILRFNGISSCIVSHWDMLTDDNVFALDYSSSPFTSNDNDIVDRDSLVQRFIDPY